MKLGESQETRTATLVVPELLKGNFDKWFLRLNIVKCARVSRWRPSNINIPCAAELQGHSHVSWT